MLFPHHHRHNLHTNACFTSATCSVWKSKSQRLLFDCHFCCLCEPSHFDILITTPLADHQLILCGLPKQRGHAVIIWLHHQTLALPILSCPTYLPSLATPFVVCMPRSFCHIKFLSQLCFRHLIVIWTSHATRVSGTSEG